LILSSLPAQKSLAFKFGISFANTLCTNRAAKKIKQRENFGGNPNEKIIAESSFLAFIKLASFAFRAHVRKRTEFKPAQTA
jgi:hypothetical protein